MKQINVYHAVTDACLSLHEPVTSDVPRYLPIEHPLKVLVKAVLTQKYFLPLFGMIYDVEYYKDDDAKGTPSEVHVFCGNYQDPAAPLERYIIPYALLVEQEEALRAQAMLEHAQEKIKAGLPMVQVHTQRGAA